MKDEAKLRAVAIERFQAGHYPAALDRFDEIVASGNAGPAAYGWRGLCLQLLGCYAEAIADYQRAIELDGEYQQSLHQLAYIYACCPVSKFRDGRLAASYATRACQASSWRNWVCISGLAAAFAELGDFDQAVHFAQMAMELAPADEQENRRKRLEQYRNRGPVRSTIEDDRSRLQPVVFKQ